VKFLITVFISIFILISSNAKADEYESRQYKFIIESNNDMYVFEINIVNTIAFPALTFLNTETYDSLMEFTCLVILNPMNASVLSAKYSTELGSDLVGMVDTNSQKVSDQYIDGMATAGVVLSSANPNSVMMYTIVQNMNGRILDTNNNTVYSKSCSDVVNEQLNEFGNMVGASGDFANEILNEIRSAIFFWE
tara:strand:+ start:206 stop:784 length:579 start_codon:yes stop_codon:yes gene_type:complete